MDDSAHQPDPHSTLVTVANCFDLLEAQQFQMVLEVCNIPSFIPDENTAGVAPYQFMTISGVRLQVAEDHAEEAKRIIEQERENKAEAADSTPPTAS